MSNKILIVDVETTGLDPQVHSALSLAAIVWDDCRTIGEFSCYVTETNVVLDQEAIAINRIDLSVVKTLGLTPKEVVRDLVEFIRVHFTELPVVLGGHNVQFDVGFLKRLFRLAEVDFAKVFSHRVLDTAGIAQFLKIALELPLRTASSTEVFRAFDVSIAEDERHTALGDARATATLLSKMVDWARAH